MFASSRGLPNSPREKLTVFHTGSNASVVSSCGTRPIGSRAWRIVGLPVLAVDAALRRRSA